ncbi:MAG TPA: pyrimidine/purine nucleoside phosphorylase [Duganella sp.]|nr:pyrimidine/purine nucleoside phosphorylase [Duganella sp.]
MVNHFDHVSIEKRAHVYLDGRCISYNLTFPDHSKKTLGVVLPGCVTFAADAAQTMEIVAGKCRVRLSGGEWQNYEQGQRFHVPGHTSFEVETAGPLHYVCHLSNQGASAQQAG